jgi:hypothetical protein
MNQLQQIQIETPILLIGFNRPEVIKESFSFIKLAKPTKLFVAIDAARPNKANEEQLVDEVKQIVQQVDWECQVLYKFNEENLGAEYTVSNAISWVLSIEETVIVLEDDIIAPMAFLQFAETMLDKYKNDENIYMISGGQYTPLKNIDTDYYFAMHSHTGSGWATWRRAWGNFDLQIKASNRYEEILEDPINNYSLEEQLFFKKRFEKMKRNGVGNSTWDLCWNYTRLINNGLSIIPRVNLTTNIGVFGLHANGFHKAHFLDFDINFICENEPIRVERNVFYDQHHYNTYLSPDKSLFYRVYLRILSIFKINHIVYYYKKNSYLRKKNILSIVKNDDCK